MNSRLFLASPESVPPLVSFSAVPLPSQSGWTAEGGREGGKEGGREEGRGEEREGVSGRDGGGKRGRGVQN